MHKLNIKDIDFMLKSMVIPIFLQEKLKKLKIDSSILNEEDLDMLYDICAQHFQLFGVNVNDEANDYGLRIETLIDKINSY